MRRICLRLSLGIIVLVAAACGGEYKSTFSGTIPAKSLQGTTALWTLLDYGAPDVDVLYEELIDDVSGVTKRKFSFGTPQQHAFGRVPALITFSRADQIFSVVLNAPGKEYTITRMKGQESMFQVNGEISFDAKLEQKIWQDLTFVSDQLAMLGRDPKADVARPAASGNCVDPPVFPVPTVSRLDGGDGYSITISGALHAETASISGPGMGEGMQLALNGTTLGVQLQPGGTYMVTVIARDAYCAPATVEITAPRE